MNFPETHRLGRLAEIKVEEIFTSWSWTVGKDHIDTGYDFFVQPDVSKFNGHRFLVQVKATSRSANGRTAKVSRARLREYAKNPIPVFLIWSSPNAMHWMGSALRREVVATIAFPPPERPTIVQSA